MRKALTKIAILFHDCLLPWLEPYTPARRWKRIRGSVDERVLYDFALKDQSDRFDKMKLAGLLHRPTFEAASSVPGDLCLKAAERLADIPCLWHEEKTARILTALLVRCGRSDGVLRAHILDRIASEDLLGSIKIRCAPELIAQAMELFPEPLLQELLEGRHRALRLKASRMLNKPAEDVWRLVLKSADEPVWRDGDDQDIAWVIDELKSPDVLLYIAVFADREATRRLAANRLRYWNRLPHAEAVFAVLVEQNSDEEILENAISAVHNETLLETWYDRTESVGLRAKVLLQMPATAAREQLLARFEADNENFAVDMEVDMQCVNCDGQGEYRIGKELNDCMSCSGRGHYETTRRYSVRDWLDEQEERSGEPANPDANDKKAGPNAAAETRFQNSIDTVYRSLIRLCDSIPTAKNLFERIRREKNTIAAANDSPELLLDAALLRLDQGKDIQDLLARNSSHIRNLSRSAAQKIKLCPTCGAEVSWQQRFEDRREKVEVMDERLSHGDVSYFPKYKTEWKTVQKESEVLYCASCDDIVISFSQ